MKRKLMMVGLVAIILLLISAISILLGGAGAWLLFEFQEKPQYKSVKIAHVVPLKVSETVSTAEKEHNTSGQTSSSSEAVVAAVKQSPVIITSTPAPNPTLTPTATPTPTVSPTPTAVVTSRLEIPKLGLTAPILSAPVTNGTWQVDHLGQSVGYLEGTAPPGSNSNFVLAGHVTLSPGELGPFAGLGQLTYGDIIAVYDKHDTFYYMIETIRVVARSNVDVVYPSETGMITLITCTNWNSEAGRYTDRIVVKGRLVSGY